MKISSDMVEARLREYYTGSGTIEPTAPTGNSDDPVRDIVRQANRHTGSRDLVALAVTAFLTLLLAFAPGRGKDKAG